MSGWLLSLFSHEELRERRIGAIFYAAWQGSHMNCRMILSMYYKVGGARSSLACGPTASCTGAKTEPAGFVQRKHSINTFWMHKIN